MNLNYQPPNHPIAEMNLTPLVDVMMVLMIIFMVTSPIDPTGIDLTLPDAQSAPVPRAPDTLVVAMDAELRIRAAVGEEPAREATLETLPAVLQKHFSGRVKAHVKADRSLTVQDFMTLLVRLNASGITQIGILAEPLPEEKTDRR
ncbi:biopolymer transporter ExbD [Myxococcota bacterium]|nr:biopolymer transporter ExbD [Myxococcota bacterium]